MSASDFSARATRFVQDSGAYQNSFFAKCKATKSISPSAVLPYFHNWYFVTKHFALAGLNYNRLLAEKLRDEKDPAEKERLQGVLLQTVRITAEDFGLGLNDIGNPHGVGGIHYSLFGNMAAKIGFDGNSADKSGLKSLEKETKQLIHSIEKNYSNPIRGVACFRVVEGIAYNIVDSMRPLCLAIEKNGKKIYLDSELVYVNMHLQIEKRHSEQATDMVSLLGHTLKTQKQIMEGVEEITNSFSRFWNRMEVITFKK